MYYPPAIQEPSPSGSRTDTPSKVVEVGKDSTVTIPTSSDKHTKEAEQPEVIEKEKDAN